MKPRNLLFPALLLIFWILTGCGPAPTPEPTVTPAFVFPTLGPLPSPTATRESVSISLCPNPDCIDITPQAGAPEPLRLDIPTPGAEPVSAWRPPQYSIPLALGPFDHFYFARPIGADDVNWPIADYRYGGTFLNKDVTHTGVDISAKAGTPVLAAGPGTVVWAGWGLFSGTPENIYDAYGIAAAIRHDFGYQGRPLYTIYAHMSDVTVAVGEQVNSGTQLGYVGATGYTTGPHLHFEVRLGENNYFFTRNPELWLAPAQGWGVLAGRVMGNDGIPTNSAVVYIDALNTRRQWVVNTYGSGPANPDPYYSENMVISDLPAGDYTVQIIHDGKSYKLNIKISPGRVTFFSFRGTHGFSLTPPPAPAIFTPTPAR
jgi:murein DD-endopeptidase MepM/ murein hydrolase activator NlpD